MKTNKELKELKENYEALNETLSSLTEEELAFVTGGTGRPDKNEEELWFEGTDVDNIAM